MGNQALTYSQIASLATFSRPALGRLISDSNGTWSHESFDTSLISDEVLICLLWEESKFDPTADAGWPTQGYGLGQMTRIGAQETDRYTKSASYYPTAKDAAIARDVTRAVADGFMNATPGETLARSKNADEQIAVSLALLAINGRKNNGDLRKTLKQYGPPGASYEQYADVIVHCGSCVKNSKLKNSKGVPVPVGTKKDNVDKCDDCLTLADKERTSAYGK